MIIGRVGRRRNLVQFFCIFIGVIERRRNLLADDRWTIHGNAHMVILLLKLRPPLPRVTCVVLNPND